MKKIKLILFTIGIFIITGCSADYEIDITDDDVIENIKLTIPDSMDQKKKEEFLGYTENDTVAITWDYDNPYYTMTKDRGINEDYYNYNYVYDKTHPIKDSRVLKTCFDHYKIEETDSYYMFVFKGKFKCAYDFDEVNIKLKTANEVSKHNSTDYDGPTGTYRWKLDNTNYDDADIRFIVLKDSYPTKIKDTSTSIFKNIFITIFIIGTIILGYIFIKKLISIVDKVGK